MVIFSTGSFTRGAERWARAMSMDRLPMRPQYIMAMTTARLRGDRSRVMPVDSPTVLRAENTSNRAS